MRVGLFPECCNYEASNIWVLLNVVLEMKKKIDSIVISIILQSFAYKIFLFFLQYRWMNWMRMLHAGGLERQFISIFCQLSFAPLISTSKNVRGKLFQKIVTEPSLLWIIVVQGPKIIADVVLWCSNMVNTDVMAMMFQ